MVDFDKLRGKKQKALVFDPRELFLRLPKPHGINDLYLSQAEVLASWFDRRSEPDLVVKLHTGGGKTLVALLMGQSTLNELRQPVLYLAPTRQLVRQTLAKAEAYGIPAVEYLSGQPLNDSFLNAHAIMVATYKALFNGLSKFGVRGGRDPIPLAAVIADDAHVASSEVRDSFTLTIEDDGECDDYRTLTAQFRKAFSDINRLGTFEDVISGADRSILEVPHWAWLERLEAVRAVLKSSAETHKFVWPLLRDRLHLCHALISKSAFTITPILPLVDLFPSFCEAKRRIYMSATIPDDSDIVRVFDADAESAAKPLTSRSLAGTSERMILIPGLMDFEFDEAGLKRMVAWAVEKQEKATIILVPSDAAAERWSDVATVAKGTDAAQARIEELQSGGSLGPFVFANRYDGIDLPEDKCRLLVMAGLPKGSSDYDLFRASALHGSNLITRMLAQRVEQGIGRGARGAGDFCVVILAGADLSGWVALDANFRLLTSATQAQVEMGIAMSKEINGPLDLANTMLRCYQRDKAWTGYHAEVLAERTGAGADSSRIQGAAVERKALQLWSDGFHAKALERLQKFIDSDHNMDKQAIGWMQQFASRIAAHWGNEELSQRHQENAYGNNRNVCRPLSQPVYRPMAAPGEQEHAIVSKLGGYRLRRGYLQNFEDVVSYLTPEASANQFEEALANLGRMLGFEADRPERGQNAGPDVLWLITKDVGITIEAKSRKRQKSALRKEEHGQLLVSAEWFKKNYPGYTCIRVSVHPEAKATRSAVAGASHALTYERLGVLIADARKLLKALCQSHLPEGELLGECARLLAASDLHASRFASAYLLPFEQA